jgi:hypothetical protein
VVVVIKDKYKIIIIKMKFYNKLIKKPQEINNEEYEQYTKAKESINKLTENIKILEITTNNYIKTLKQMNELNINNINISLYKER